MSRRTASAVAIALTCSVVSTLGLSACGETVDLRDGDTTATTIDPTEDAGDPVEPIPVEPIPVDGSLDEILAVMLTEWRGLGEHVIDGDAAEPLARIEQGWAAIEPVIRTEHSDSYSGFQQAIDLARTSVERRRPADASKGYLVAVDLAAEVRDR